MVKLLMGLKGSGKSKKLLQLLDEAVDSETGDIVFIEPTSKLIHDVPQRVRLIDASQYDFTCIEFFKGFITGLYCSNYDITHIFIDGVLKIVHQGYDDNVDAFIKWCEKFGNKEDIKFTITISEDVAKASDDIKKFF